MYYDRVYLCEGQKWDLEREVRKRDYEVQEKIRRKKRRNDESNGQKKRTSNNARRKRAIVSRTFLLCTTPHLTSLSSRCLSLFRPSFLYIRPSLSSFSLSRCFSWRTRRVASSATRNRGENKKTAFCAARNGEHDLSFVAWTTLARSHSV